MGRGSSGGAAEDSGGDDEGVTQDEITSEDPDSADFGDLFAVADPRTNEDKALVAAYWRQVHEGQEKWQSTVLQKDLRNLGHAIPNITDALTSNIRKRPSASFSCRSRATHGRRARRTR